MKKKTILTAAFALLSMSSFAGGLTTNTNQNASFLRQLSQEAIIDINGLYANPAGTAFLSKGFHLSLNIQNARQSRDITTTYPLMGYNVNDRTATRKYHGSAYAPVIPSATLSYNWDKWSLNAHFGITGGGGKCEFDDGLGTFESFYSAALYRAAQTMVVPQANAAVAAAAGGLNPDYQYAGYSLNAYMKGRQYYYGFQVGTTYKFNEKLAGFFGLRGIWASNNYNGWVEDVHVHLASASPYASALGDYANYTYNAADYELSLNTDQTGFGITPIIGIDWRLNEHWNFGAKFEGRTKLNLKNKSQMNDFTKITAETNPTLGQFKDGGKVRADLPGILYLGAQYSPMQKLRLNGGFHYYFDKQAKQYGDKQDLLDHGTWEVTAGAEYDVHERVTVSAGWQTTNYGLTDAYMNDLSFVTNSNSIGLGVRVKVTDHFNVDLGFMQTIYHREDVDTENYLVDGLTKSDHYWRKNRVLGIGFNLAF